MDTRLVTRLLAVTVVLGLGMAACNTTKATVDTLVKFTSSTSPDSLFNQDGIVDDRHKVSLYTAVVFDNLQQDIARGHGEYLTSFAVLLNIEGRRHPEWEEYAQSRYAALFADVSPPGEAARTRLQRELARARAD
jgi:hypothetical protein